MAKWNYAVMRSIFGDIWVGKTKLPVKRDKVFADIETAKQRAEMIFEDMHPDFDTIDEDENDMDLQDQYDNLIDTSEDNAEEIRKKMENFII